MDTAIAALVLLALPATGWAQGYTVGAGDGLAEERPATASPVAFGERSSAALDLPFAFRLYGREIARVAISPRGWLRPGDTADAPPGAFPFAPGAAADGAIAPFFTSRAADAVFTWTKGAAPSRVFVVSWETAGSVAQAQLGEGTDRIVFAYRTAVVTGKAAEAERPLVGIDEPDGARFAAPEPAAGGRPAGDVVLEPRTVLVNALAAPKRGAFPVWQESRRETVTAPGSAEGACYVAKGSAWFFVADRVLTGADPATGRPRRGPRRERLVAEDAADFGGEGDPERFVKQVLDAKAILVPRDGGPPERVWFRVVEWFSVEDSGLAGPDEHVWNLRAMLKMAFPEGDPRARIERYGAWRGMARARLSVVKLFDAAATSDAAGQYDSSRRGEYVLWCAKFRTGTIPSLRPDETPGEGWTRFALQDENLDRVAEQHAEKRDVRDVADPEYVDGGYTYVVSGDGPVPGWESLPGVPRSSLPDETFDEGTHAPR